MKKILLLAAATILMGVSANAATKHSMSEYSNNSHLALEDGYDFYNEWDYAKARECFDIYHQLTGKDITEELNMIDEKLATFPRWFDPNKMIILCSIGDNGALVVIYNELFSNDVWADEFEGIEGVMTIKGTKGLWDCRTHPSLSALMTERGLYIPDTGLFGKMAISHQQSNKTITNPETGEEFEMPNERKDIQVATYGVNGDGKIHDCGSYQVNSGFDGHKVITQVVDERVHKIVHFYPMKLIIPVGDGAWKETSIYDNTIDLKQY